MRCRTAVAVVCALLVAAGCSSPASDRGAKVPSALPSSSALPQSPAGSPRVLAQGLEVPWGVAFLPSGDALVTERDTARLLLVSREGQVRTIQKITGVDPDVEGGLLGIAVPPSGDAVYLYFTAARDNRILGYDYAGGRLSNPRVLVRGIPKGSFHNGGRLAFGPDGFLYATTGEVGEESLAQNRSSLGGKILRMKTDGSPAPGNPFGTLVWTYGHRNVQGLAWDPAGRLYATEFGADTWDEVNRIEKGRNYGWPAVEGSGGRGKGFVDPLLTWRPSEASPSGMAYAGGSLWAGALRGQRLWQIPLGRDGSVGKPKALFQGVYGRIRAVVATPSGDALWLTTTNKDQNRGELRPGDDKIIVLPLR